MLFVRFIFGFLFLSVILLTAHTGRCSTLFNSVEFNVALAERAKQYQESLQKRIQHFSPSLRSKLTSQAQQTVSKGLTQWKQGKLNIWIALPRWAVSGRFARLIARHSPFPGAPDRSFVLGIDMSCAAVIVVSVQSLFKTWTALTVDTFVQPTHSGILSRQNNLPSYFVQIVQSVILRL